MNELLATNQDDGISGILMEFIFCMYSSVMYPCGKKSHISILNIYAFLHTFIFLPFFRKVENLDQWNPKNKKRVGGIQKIKRTLVESQEK